MSEEENNNAKPKAVVLDMDGVLTQTAKIHKQAWKEMFNAFLEKEPEDYPAMEDADYYKYLDGKPRYKGVESFLQSRNIDLPYGNPEDSPDQKTVCGLGNRKNEIYTGLLKEQGAEKYTNAIQKVKHWKKEGLKTAVVTSSKNGKLVLESAGIDDLFDVRIDGVTAEERNLKGKPNADIFLEAAKDLGVKPGECALFEDAISGVQAGSNGNFALVVGVARNENKRSLSNNGADVVIEDFDELDLLHNKELLEHFAQPVPSLLSEYERIQKVLDKRTPVLFLDYDGTLTPIVKRPENAVISEQMKEVLQKCAEKFRVAAVSGRDMDDLKNMIQLDSLIYAGSHGFRISGPDGLYKEHEKTEEILPLLDKIEEKLNREFPEIDKGVQIDRKRYAIGVHYRNAKQENVPAIKQKVDKIISENEGLKKGAGKKIVELKPDVDWHKGKAVLWIMEALGVDDREKYVPMYIGDDVTDEDAFKTIEEFGIGILVGFHGHQTAARYRLKNVYQVRIFLEKLYESMK